MANPNRAEQLKNYVEVPERITRFYAKYPEGRIESKIVEQFTSIAEGYVTYEAKVYPNQSTQYPIGVGIAHESAHDSRSYVNKQGWIFENAQTSAVGRAIAFAGIGVEKGIASREDMARAYEREDNPPPARPAPAQAAKQAAEPPSKPPTQAQWNAIKKLSEEKGVDIRGEIEHTLGKTKGITFDDLAGHIKYLASLKPGAGYTRAAGYEPPQEEEESEQEVAEEGGAPYPMEQITKEQIAEIMALGESTHTDIELEVSARYEQEAVTLLNQAEAEDFIEWLKAQDDYVPAPPPARATKASAKNPEPKASAVDNKADVLARSIYGQLHQMTQPHEVSGAAFFDSPKAALAYVAAWGSELYNDFPASIKGVNDIPAAYRQIVLEMLTNEAAAFAAMQSKKKSAPAKKGAKK